ncbi:hypothetical protein [Pedobacter paludis]|uniref:Uncharacterized protein n=1 Tax=Pedobacter paludis TaxID=2203212 RepID=A0A317F2N2_9SPHI|nr:hypothetical protein [Pedobacter paludis]PWS32533.1 hypothetical protein DF947_05495 [Pedobacter paludis]
MFKIFSNDKAKNMPSNQFQASDATNQLTKIDIPENVFIEKEVGSFGENNESKIKKPESTIESLFDFLDKNHETKGYEDALMNPDVKHLNQNVDALNNQLERLLEELKPFMRILLRRLIFTLIVDHEMEW